MAARKNSNILTSMVIARNGFPTILCDFETTYEFELLKQLIITHPFIAWGKKRENFRNSTLGMLHIGKCFIIRV